MTPSGHRSTMHLVHVETADARVVPGVRLPDDSVAPLPTLLGDNAPPTVTHALAALPELATLTERQLERVRQDPEAAVERGALIPAAAARLRAPVGDRNLILCAGGNYKAHNAEMGVDVPARAPSFVKSPSCVIGPGEKI